MTKRRLDSNEPLPEEDGEEWVDCGGELVWAMGFTSGGAPYGLTEADFRRMNAEADHRRGWARARNLLAWAFEACTSPTTEVDVGYVSKIGEGAYRKVYAAEVTLTPDTDHLGGTWAVLLPDHGAKPEDGARWEFEVTVLAELQRESLPFRVPPPLGVFPLEPLPAVVRRLVDGVPTSERAGRALDRRPPELVGAIAAAVHRVDWTSWTHRPRGPATWREHGERLLRVFDDLADPVIDEVREWCFDHLPPDRPSVLLHGDLRPPNILLHPELPPAVIDWEFCRVGDPAHDLAVVTGGVRRPFKLPDGRHRLLKGYREGGGEPPTLAAVGFHELCLAARSYRGAAEEGDGRAEDFERSRLRNMLHRIRRSDG